MDLQHPSSPVEVDDGGWRGRVRGVTRIGGKAGFAAAAVLAALVILIVYGVSTSGHRRAARPAETVPLTKASEQHTAWWDDVPATQPSVPVLSESPIPAHAGAPSAGGRLNQTQPQRVPDLQSVPVSEPLTPAQTARQDREERQRQLLDAAVNAPIAVRLDERGGEAAAAQGNSQAAQPLNDPALVSGAAAIPAAYALPAFVAAAAVSHDALPSVPRSNSSPYVLRAGDTIPATLLTGVNADLPGTVVAQVRDDVFDSVSGEYLLVPRGAKLTGTYDSRVVQGQRRLLVAWTRLLYPDGSSLDLLGMAGTDPSGYAGFSAKVNDHFNKVFTSALLLSIIGAGAQLSQPQQSAVANAAPGVGQTIAGAVGQQIGNTSIQLTQRNLQIPPTLEVEPGYRFDVLVDRDIVLPTPYGNQGVQ